MSLVLVFCAAFVGSGLKAIGGFGFATLTTPAIALFWDVPTAIAVTSIPTLLTSVVNIWRTRSALSEGLAPFLPFFLASLAGLAAGLTILLSADPRLMKLFLGAFLFGQILWQWLSRREGRPPERSLPRSLGMGALAGLMLGTVNTLSHVVAVYLTGLRLSKERYLFVLSASQLVLRTASFGSIAVAGYFDREAMLLTAVILAPVALGFLAGTRLYAGFSDRIFFRVVMGILLILAASLVVGNAGAILPS